MLVISWGPDILGRVRAVFRGCQPRGTKLFAGHALQRCQGAAGAVSCGSVCASPVLCALQAAALDFLTVCPHCSNLTFGERPRQPNPHFPSVHPELRSDGICGSSFLVPLAHHGRDPGQDPSLAVTVLMGISHRALGMVHRRWLCLWIS